MKMSHFRQPNLSRSSFARTNAQTIAQRATLLRELMPGLNSVAEICCGDCSRQYQIYSRELDIQHFHGLDLEPAIVEANRSKDIDCYLGNALDVELLRHLSSDDVIFFGPPLSEDCDGHRLLNFDEITPTYSDFAQLLLGKLNYTGLLVCICPKSTSLGNINQLYHKIRDYRPDVNLRLIHYSYSTMTSNDEITELRLKYVEIWFSSKFEDLWEVRESKV